MNSARHAAKPIFHLLAGPNGAGKSTLYRALVSNGDIGKALEFVNADLYEQSHLQHIVDLQKRSEAARVWADDRREALLNAKTSYVSETVFSHESKLALITQAQALATAGAAAEGTAAACIDAAGYRDHTGIGRNLTVQVLEFFKREGLTRFDGTRHWLLSPATREVGGAAAA